MALPDFSMRQLLEAGVHYGHQTQRWNPRMAEYIYGDRNGIHIIDLTQTVPMLDAALNVIRETVAKGGRILFVGTKRQAQKPVAEAAEKCAQYYMNHRWLGGTLTNFPTIRRRVDYMIKLEQQRERGDFERLTKKEALELERLITKLNLRLGGLREMRRLPDLVFITDVCREEIAVQECNKLNIPIIAMVDTNCDPDPVDLVIPANDDAIRAIKLIAGVIAQGASEGQMMREIVAAEEEDDYRGGRGEEIKEPESFLGPSTLAKLARGFEDMEDEETIGSIGDDDVITGLDLSDFVIEDEAETTE